MSPIRSVPGTVRRVVTGALGVLALLGAALVLIGLGNQVGDPPAPGSPAADHATQSAASAPGAPVTVSAAPGPARAGPSDAATVAEPLDASEPTHLNIPAIGLSESLFPIGLHEDGALAVPTGERAHQPAWFHGSPTPGETGPAVIEGHVTWRGEPSVFFEVGALAPGDRIDVAREDGSTATFQVYDIARYPKDEFPTLAVYGRTDGPELRLITCAGDLDREGHHLDNIVVYAAPTPP